MKYIGKEFIIAINNQYKTILLNKEITSYTTNNKFYPQGDKNLIRLRVENYVVVRERSTKNNFFIEKKSLSIGILRYLKII